MEEIIPNKELINIYETLKDVNIGCFIDMQEVSSSCFSALSQNISGVTNSSSDDSWDDQIKDQISKAIESIVAQIDKQKAVCEGKIGATGPLVESLVTTIDSYDKKVKYHNIRFSQKPEDPGAEPDRTVKRERQDTPGEYYYITNPYYEPWVRKLQAMSSWKNEINELAQKAGELEKKALDEKSKIIEHLTLASSPQTGASGGNLENTSPTYEEVAGTVLENYRNLNNNDYGDEAKAKKLFNATVQYVDMSFAKWLNGEITTEDMQYAVNVSKGTYDKLYHNGPSNFKDAVWSADRDVVDRYNTYVTRISTDHKQVEGYNYNSTSQGSEITNNVRDSVRTVAEIEEEIRKTGGTPATGAELSVAVLRDYQSGKLSKADASAILAKYNNTMGDDTLNNGYLDAAQDIMHWREEPNAANTDFAAFDKTHGTSLASSYKDSMLYVQNEANATNTDTE